MNSLNLNKLDLQEVNATEMESVNGGLEYVWHDGAGPIQYAADAIYNGIVSVNKLWNWAFN